MREKGRFPGQDIEYDFDNVTFVLNALDTLAGDNRFLEIRKRRPEHRTLARFEEHASAARAESIAASEKRREAHDDVIRQATKEVDKVKQSVSRKVKEKHLDDNAAAQLLATDLNNVMRRLEETRAESDLKYDRELEQVNDNLDAKILEMKYTYKFWAIIAPPIPLLLVALGVFIYRRVKESEGVSSQRLR
jgi:ABC-2 type transport system permease protein